MSWFQQIFRRRSLYSDLHEELRQHLEEKTEQLMRDEGLTRGEAEQQARSEAAKSGSGFAWKASGPTQSSPCVSCSNLQPSPPLPF
jgi:hypothetical protein